MTTRCNCRVGSWLRSWLRGSNYGVRIRRHGIWILWMRWDGIVHGFRWSGVRNVVIQSSCLRFVLIGSSIAVVLVWLGRCSFGAGNPTVALANKGENRQICKLHGDVVWVTILTYRLIRVSIQQPFCSRCGSISPRKTIHKLFCEGL